MRGRLPFTGLVGALALLALLGFYAVRIGFPDTAALFGLYALAGMMIFLIGNRLQQNRRMRGWGRLASGFGVLVGLGGLYCLSDAYVQEKAFFAYPADQGWFFAYALALILLLAVSLLRNSRQEIRKRRKARIRAMGFVLLVVLLSIQMLTLTGALHWTIMAGLHRTIYLAFTVWLVIFGHSHDDRAVRLLGHLFLWAGLMTIYLDLLWPWREGVPFLSGWAAFGLVAAFGQKLWDSRLTRREETIAKP